MSNEKWTCSNCGYQNEEGDNFCGECGSKKPERELGIGVGRVVSNQINPASNSRTIPEQSACDNLPEDNAATRNMGMMEAVKSAFSNYVTFSGRARRSEYWFFTLFNMLISIAITIVTVISGIPAIGYLSYLYSLIVLVPGWAVFVRRLHDVGKSGWNWLWLVVPVIGWILVLVWLATDSQSGSNQYGSSPK